MLNNLFLLAVHQLCGASTLQVIDNGLGLAIFGAEDLVVDYAVLAADKKATLSNQVF